MLNTLQFQEIKQIGAYQYHLSHKLGSGNFGVVFKGVNTQSQQEVAIKIVNREKLNTDYLKQILQNEINSMKKVGHCKNIVKFMDVLESKNNIYIVQEYCNGGDLKQFQSRFINQRIPENQAFEIIRQILKGLLKLSKHGIVHRDLKPENILINNNLFKIADFGLSKSVENFQFELLNSTLGTPLYMGYFIFSNNSYKAPQMLKAGHYTSKCDVWSLGVIFYELLCGKIPWKNPLSQIDLLQKIQKNKVKFPSDLPISIQTKEFILNCLQYEECKRYSFENIFINPLFKNCFKYKEKLKKFGKKSKNIIQKLAMVINNSGIFLEDAFKISDKNCNDLIEFNELFDLLKQIDQEITREECEYIFNQFDLNKDNKITFSEFKYMMNQIALLGKFDKQSIQTQLKQQQKQRIKKVMQESQIDLQQLFLKYDHDKSNLIDYNEFTQMIKELIPDLHQHQIINLFNSFDLNKDGNINILEFVKVFSSPQSPINKQLKKHLPCLTPQKYDQLKIPAEKNKFIRGSQEKHFSILEQKICQIIQTPVHKYQMQNQGQIYFSIQPKNAFLVQPKPIIQTIVQNGITFQQPVVYQIRFQNSPSNKYFH